MPLTPGSRIGPYEIREILGAGGMGVVYKARDDRLRRDLAIKTLKAEDNDTAQRFLREAQTASALNHPNIVTIYDIGTTEESGPYIAMEYIAGTTLRDLLAGNRLAMGAVLEFSLQLARALSRAHAASIIHRDLKPANVIVASDGMVKVLDFGLAKALQTAADGDAQTTRVSISGPLTIAGTIPYMSPEQVVGNTLDQRTDVFSFGVILYEMATGRHPFAHETRDATVAAILHGEVTFFEKTTLPAARALEAIIRKCLVKDRHQRYQSIDLVLRDLEAAQQLLAPAASRSNMAAVLAIAAVVVVAIGVWEMIPARPVSEQILRPVPVTSYEGDEIQPTLSPEGDRVAFSWNGETQDNFDIYAKLLDSGAPLRLTSDAADDSSPAWSPDGRSIAFLRGRASESGAVFVLPAMGGPERKIADVRLPPPFFLGRTLAWSPDGKRLVCGCGENATLILISADTGAQRALADADKSVKSRGNVSPAFSRDGTQLAFARFLRGPGEIFVIPLNEDYTARGTARQLTFDNRVAFGPTWLSDADLLFVAGPSNSELRLWRMPVAGNRSATSLASLGDNVSNPIASQPGPNGGVRVVYERRSFDTNIWRLDLASGSSGALSRLASSSADDNDPSVSPNADELLFGTKRSGRFEVWLSEADGSRARPLLLGTGAAGARWSPDGTEIVYESQESGRHIAVANRDGTNAQRVTAIRDGVVPSFSRDGQWIYFSADQPIEGPQVWKVGHPKRGNAPGQPIQLTKRGGTYSEESVDGAFVYYAKRFSTGPIWRVPSAGGQEELVINEAVHWSNFAVVSDGIYYIAVPRTGAASSSQLYGVPGNALRFFRFSDGQTQTVRTLARPAYMGLSISRDRSKAFLTQVDQQGSDLMVVDDLH